jgi:hypothetical protein
MKAALYIRVSTVDQNSELQVRELRAYAEHQGWDITEVYQDVMSGARSSCPALNQLTADVRARKFDCTDEPHGLERILAQTVLTLGLHDNVDPADGLMAVIVDHRYWCLAVGLTRRSRVYILHLGGGVARATCTRLRQKWTFGQNLNGANRVEGS